MSKTILIAEDQRPIRALLYNILKVAGYKVMEAEDGVKALKILSGNQDIDLIITDLNMPNMDGIQLIKETKKLSKHLFTPICMLTTESERSKLVADESISIETWLTKPIQPVHILNEVGKILPI